MVAGAAVLAVTAIYAARISGTAARIEMFACVAVAAGLVVMAVVNMRPAGAVRQPRLVAAAAALAICAVLIAPAAASVTVVHSLAFDAERSGAMPPGWPPLIDRYLAAHRHWTRYAFASVAPGKAAPLIAADPQPVLMLTSYRSRPLISVPRLRHLVRAGEVRYFLIGRRCTNALIRTTAACPATARWAIAHSTDVTRAVGIGRGGLLYRINRCASASASGRGRSARRSAARRSARNASHANRATCVRFPRA
jgi:hypothetical protein